MTILDVLLLTLLVLSCTIGLIIALVLSNFIALKTPSGIKTLYSALIIILLLLVIALATKFIFTEDNNWLPSFQTSDECDKQNPPFWCNLDTSE